MKHMGNREGFPSDERYGGASEASTEDSIRLRFGETGKYLDMIPVGFLVLQGERIKYANLEASRLFVENRGQLLGDRLYNYVSSEDKRDIHQKLSSLGRDCGIFHRDDVRILCSDGKKREINVTASVDGAYSNEVITILLREADTSRFSHIRHIHAQPDYSKELAFVERLGLMGSWHWDRVTGDVAWSEQLFRILGLDPEKVGSSMGTLREHTFDEDLSELLSLQSKLEVEGEPYSYEYRIKKENGDIHWVYETAEAILGPSGQVSQIRGILQDVSERKEREETFAKQAHVDDLTGLPNRLAAQIKLQELCQRKDGLPATFYAMQIVVDDYKRVRDALGLQASDELIKIISARLRSCISEDFTLARLEGVEFLALIDDNYIIDDVKACIHRIQAMFSIPLSLESKRLNLTTSIGVACYPEDGDSPDALMRYVDTATSVAASGPQRAKNSYSLFKPNMADDITRRLEMESQLWHGLLNQEFEVHFQPQINIATGRICGAEALMRWNSPQLGWVSPGEFIPIAEETGMIIEIGKWVLEQSCAFTRRCLSMGVETFQVGVNVSPVQFQDDDLLDHLEKCLDKFGLPASSLEIEITEGVLIDKSLKAEKILTRMKEIGVHLSLDDFGTGYSSISYLQRLKFDTLKIDQSFVRDICTDSDTRVIVRSIVAMAKRLSMSVITEGVEDPAQFQLLQKFNCDKSQGFYHAKPMERERFLELLKEDMEIASDLAG